MIDKQRHVFGAFAQRRYLKRNNIEAVKEIGSKITVVDEAVERLVCRGNHANIDLDGRVAADRLKTLFL